jgi:hypothetical protein
MLTRSSSFIMVRSPRKVTTRSCWPLVVDMHQCGIDIVGPRERCMSLGWPRRRLTSFSPERISRMPRTPTPTTYQTATLASRRRLFFTRATTALGEIMLEAVQIRMPVLMLALTAITIQFATSTNRAPMVAHLRQLPLAFVRTGTRDPFRHGLDLPPTFSNRQRHPHLMYTITTAPQFSRVSLVL